MIMFKTQNPEYYGTEIEAVEVERITEASVWIEGHRRAKTSDWDCYHALWEDARIYLCEAAQQKLTGVNKKRDRLVMTLNELDEMEEPTS